MYRRSHDLHSHWFKWRKCKLFKYSERSPLPPTIDNFCMVSIYWGRIFNFPKLSLEYAVIQQRLFESKSPSIRFDIDWEVSQWNSEVFILMCMMRWHSSTFRWRQSIKIAYAHTDFTLSWSPSCWWPLDACAVIRQSSTASTHISQLHCDTPSLSHGTDHWICPAWNVTIKACYYFLCDYYGLELQWQ